MPALRCCGPRFASKLAARLARGVYLANPSARARAEARICALWLRRLGGENTGETPVPHALHQTAQLAGKSFEHFGRFWAESLFLTRRLTETRWRKYVRIENEPQLARMSEDRRGCIIAMGWHGNIAAAACALGHLFRPLHVVVDTRHVMVSKLWHREVRRASSVRIVDARDASRVLPGVLESGGAVLLIAEHEHPRGRGVPVTYLGRTFNAQPTIGVLSCRFDAMVAVVTCRRGDGAFEFHLALHDVIDPRNAFTDGGAPGESGDPRAIVRRTLASLQAAIMESPEQYAWSLTVDKGAESAQQPRFGHVVKTGVTISQSRPEHEAPASAVRQIRVRSAGDYLPAEASLTADRY